MDRNWTGNGPEVKILLVCLPMTRINLNLSHMKFQSVNIHEIFCSDRIMILLLPTFFVSFDFLPSVQHFFHPSSPCLISKASLGRPLAVVWCDLSNPDLDFRENYSPRIAVSMLRAVLDLVLLKSEEDLRSLLFFDKHIGHLRSLKKSVSKP